MPRPDASGELLAAAERLFAEHGIPLVSDRKIAEAAGNSNHSAVRYYFGGRAGLIEALLDRHLVSLEPAREALFAESTSLLTDIRALVVPVTAALAALPQPSHRARFLRQAYNDPATVEMMRSKSDQAPVASALFDSVAAHLDHLDPKIVKGRAQLMAHILVTTCANIEERAGETTPREWADVADFLCDAIAGMLLAPITASANH